jgi:hypothetical protein
VRRIVSIFAFLLVVGSTLGAPLLAGADACAESCPDDDGGDCTLACRCCSHALRALTLGREAPAPAPRAGRSPRTERADRAPPVPEPRDIFHVPRRHLG